MQISSEQMERFEEIQEIIEELKAEIDEAQDQAQEDRDGAELLKLLGGWRALTTLETRLVDRLLKKK